MKRSPFNKNKGLGRIVQIPSRLSKTHSTNGRDKVKSFNFFREAHKMVNLRWRSGMAKDGGVEPLMADVCMGIRWLSFALTFHHGKKNEGKSKKSGARLDIAFSVP